MTSETAHTTSMRLEKSDIEAFPIGDTYLIGFARSYAAYLGLNAGPYVEKLKSDIAEREAKRRATDLENQPEKKHTEYDQVHSMRSRS